MPCQQFALTLGHSGLRIEYIAVSRSVPSGRMRWARKIPSNWAPSFRMAARERSVFQIRLELYMDGAPILKSMLEQKQLGLAD